MVMYGTMFDRDKFSKVCDDYIYIYFNEMMIK